MFTAIAIIIVINADDVVLKVLFYALEINWVSFNKYLYILTLTINYD